MVIKLLVSLCSLLSHFICLRACKICVVFVETKCSLLSHFICLRACKICVVFVETKCSLLSHFICLRACKICVVFVETKPGSNSRKLHTFAASTFLYVTCNIFVDTKSHSIPNPTKGICLDVDLVYKRYQKERGKLVKQ